MSGAPVCYLELPAPDPAAAAAFYREVFAWTVKESRLEATPYWSFRAGEGGLEGGFDPRLPVQTDGGPLLYLRVADLAATLSAAQAVGATLLRPPTPVGGAHGVSALLRDPSGNRLGLWAPR